MCGGAVRICAFCEAFSSAVAVDFTSTALAKEPLSEFFLNWQFYTLEGGNVLINYGEILMILKGKFEVKKIEKMYFSQTSFSQS